MIYQSGQFVELGDRVVVENGKTPGIVHAIIETKEQMKQWSVDEIGLLLESKPCGLLFWPESEGPAVLVCRLEM